MSASKRLLAAAILAALCPPAAAAALTVARAPVPALSAALAAGAMRVLPPAAAPLALPAPLPLPLIPSRPPLVAAPAPLAAGEPSLGVRALNNFWDGFRAPEIDDDEPVAQPLGVEPSAQPPAARGAPWLATGDPRIAAALDAAVKVARRTRTGRRALDAAEKTLSGRALPVLALDLGRNYGEYDYVENNMRLHKALFKKGRETDLAGTLVHELTHVAQHGEGVPSNALEMEIEAHLHDLDMLEELGLEPAKNTFARQARDLLAQGADKFVELIQAAVPGSVFLGDSSLDDIIDQLEQDLEEQRKLAKRSRAAAALANVIANDLILIRSPRGQASYQAFSRRVTALLRRRAAASRS